MAVAGDVGMLRWWRVMRMAFAAILRVTELTLNGCNPVGYEWRCCGAELQSTAMVGTRSAVGLC